MKRSERLRERLRLSVELEKTPQLPKRAEAFWLFLRNQPMVVYCAASGSATPFEEQAQMIDSNRQSCGGLLDGLQQCRLVARDIDSAKGR